MKTGLYANIQAKRERIKSGSGEQMRKPGSKGAPTAQAFKDSEKTVKGRKAAVKGRPANKTTKMTKRKPK